MPKNFFSPMSMIFKQIQLKYMFDLQIIHKKKKKLGLYGIGVTFYCHCWKLCCSEIRRHASVSRLAVDNFYSASRPDFAPLKISPPSVSLALGSIIGLTQRGLAQAERSAQRVWVESRGYFFDFFFFFLFIEKIFHEINYLKSKTLTCSLLHHHPFVIQVKS